MQCVYIESDSSCFLYVFCATDDIPSDAEAEAHFYHVEDPEPLPVDTGKPESLEQVLRIGTVCCKLGTVCHFICLLCKGKDTQIVICFLHSEHKERLPVSPKEIIVDVILTPIPKPSTPTDEVLIFGCFL